MNKSTKRSIAIGATIIAATAVTSVVQAEETTVSQPHTGTPATASNIDHTAEVTKRQLIQQEKADEAAKSVAEQEKAVSAADQRLRKLKLLKKTATETYEKQRKLLKKQPQKILQKLKNH